MFKETFEATKSTDKRISLYCDFRLHHPELMVDIDFVPHKYADYWDALGYSNLKALGFQESRIKSALEEPSPFDTTTDEVILAIREKLEEKRYAVDKLKDELQKIYAKAGYQKKAKAKDIEKFLSAKSYQDSKSGKRYYDITSLFNKDISLFPFVWRPNVPMKMTIDRFLNIIKTGKYKIKKSQSEVRQLKDVIIEIRSLSDHKKQAELKCSWLPAGCINGTFSYKDDSGIEKYSSFIALNYDGFDTDEEMNEARELLKTYPFVYAIFVTASGKGLKAIVLHDSTNPTFHWNLYQQVMKKCQFQQSDSSVVDLSRAQFLSYDPGLWINPEPVPYHFIYDPTLTPPVKKQEKYVAASEVETSTEDTMLDDWTSRFLFDLAKNILTDEAVVERLDKHWHEEKKEYFDIGNRHKSMLIIAGTLCKAGIAREITRDYLQNNFTKKGGDEIQRIIDYSYGHNAFGSDRRFYR